jgi:hypothetical protein
MFAANRCSSACIDIALVVKNGDTHAFWTKDAPEFLDKISHLSLAVKWEMVQMESFSQICTVFSFVVLNIKGRIDGVSQIVLVSAFAEDLPIVWLLKPVPIRLPVWVPSIINICVGLAFPPLPLLYSNRCGG